MLFFHLSKAGGSSVREWAKLQAPLTLFLGYEWSHIFHALHWDELHHFAWPQVNPATAVWGLGDKPNQVLI